MNSREDCVAAMVDIAFSLEGRSLPHEYRRALAHSLEQWLPWLAHSPGAGIHRLNLVAAGGAESLLSNRTRLTLRVPRERAAETAALAGTALALNDCSVRLGQAHVRELLPWGTLYAHVVATNDADETAFMRGMDEELTALDVRARAVCGRHQMLEDGALQGFSLMLDGLSALHALRVLEMGLGQHRQWGCGMFVPHKSASAVGSPP